MKVLSRFISVVLVALGGGPAIPAAAQAPLLIYTDYRLNGFEDWSWITRNISNTTPIHSGRYSISASGTASSYPALSFHHAEMDVRGHSNLTFWAHGGTSGGQRLQIIVEYGSTQGPAFALPAALVANTW